jgi:type I restriction enzyme, S subunit
MNVASIEDVTEFVLDGTHGSPIRTEAGIPVLSAQNVRDGALDYTTDRHTSPAEYQAFTRRLPLATGDVLLTIVGTIGRCAVLEDVRPLVFQRSVAVLRPREGCLHSRFMYHVIQSQRFQAQLSSASNQSSQAGVYLGKLKKLRIPLPPLPEQRRIAEILDTADALRAKRRAALARVDTLTQSIFLDMFGDPATNPKGWPIEGADAICDLIVDCVNRTAPVVDVPTPFKMIRTTNVKAGIVNVEEVRYVTEDVFHRWNRRATPRRGDILLTREAPVGEVGMIESDDPLFLGQRLMLYRPKLSRVTPEFLLASFQGAFLQHQMTRHGSGSTVKHLPLPACRGFQFHVPPISTQRDFSRRVVAAKQLAKTQRQSLAALSALVASVQHRAFHGQL